ncbi:MAG: hypothetical protein KGM60_03260, partial [Comamonadaceae bacterium]|nr:hypothetical protein [Comamonadaceae bacterium]
MLLPDSLNLHVQGHIAEADALRQRHSAQTILRRFADQPGVVLGDEVGMGKTFVALAVAYAFIKSNPKRPVVVMAPSGVVQKWRRDAETFKEACISSEHDRNLMRIAPADTGVDFLKLLDDKENRRANLIILSHGALHRRMADPWVKLAVLQAAVKGRHGAEGLRKRLSRFAPMLFRQANKADAQSELYAALLERPTSEWKAVMKLKPGDDDPVPQAFVDALTSAEVDLGDVFTGVAEQIPERSSANLKQRVRYARNMLDGPGGAIAKVWQLALARSDLKLPLLILDEAHRTRNPATQLAELLRASHDDLDGAGGQLANRFDRMLFLTATPFQLGHAELLNVLSRFDAIRWRGSKSPSMKREDFRLQMDTLKHDLDVMQSATERLERCWKHLLPMDFDEGEQSYGAEFWTLAKNKGEAALKGVVNQRLVGVMLAYRDAHAAIRDAERLLKPWVLRCTRPLMLPAPHQQILRRERRDGAAVRDELLPDSTGLRSQGGIKVADEHTLPFLLAARLQTMPDAPKTFAAGLASSFEALLDTRRDGLDEAMAGRESPPRLHSGPWYAAQLRQAASDLSAPRFDRHPKMKASIDLAMALWRRGEKVLIFCQYLQTGAALHRHLSAAMLDEIETKALAAIGCRPEELATKLGTIAANFDRNRPAAACALALLDGLIVNYPTLQDEAIRNELGNVLLRFLRTPTFLVRFADLATQKHGEDWVRNMFEQRDGSGLALTVVMTQFLEFLARRPSLKERQDYLDALARLQTGNVSGAEVDATFGDDEREAGERVRLVANVRRIHGATKPETRERLTLSFNTPFYPEILIASSVMTEGVNLHLNCRHIIHHDLDW